MLVLPVSTIDAILALRPNAQCRVYEDDDMVEQIEWLDETQSQPTTEEITAKLSELQAAEPLRLLREERNRLIAETDWWASSDLTMTAEQTAYRQALRDITETYSSLEEAVFPEKPE